MAAETPIRFADVLAAKLAHAENIELIACIKVLKARPDLRKQVLAAVAKAS